MVGTGAKALHHAAAHDAPAQRAHDFPELYPRRIETAAGGHIARKPFLARAEAAHGMVDLAEPPGINADPSEILHGIAEMREFPVQHRAHALRADDEIAMAEIAVHQRHLAGGPWIAFAQPAQRQFEYRTRPIEAAIFPFEIGNLLAGRHATERGQLGQRQTVDTGENIAELAREFGARGREL